MTNKTSYIDTNIFLRFLIFDDVNPNLSKKAKKIIKNIVDGKIVVQTNICIISELVYVLEGFYKLNKTEVVTKIIPLLSLDNLIIDNKAAVIATLHTYRDENVDFEDAFTYHSMNDNHINQIYTFDKKHFKRFDGINILD